MNNCIYRNINVFLKLSTIQFQYLHTFSCKYGSSQLKKTMNKVMKNNAKKRPNFYFETDFVSPNSVSKGVTGNPKRMAVLNKLFMRNISDLLSTTPEIAGLGIEINKVKITSDYKILNVYWIGTNNKDVDAILLQNAGKLRHELSQLRLMGNVPNINFVKDKQYEHLMELSNRLAIADFGDDEPINTTVNPLLISELELNLPMESNIKEKIELLEKENPVETYDIELPPMTQSVFNLDHAAIMNRIKKHKKCKIDGENQEDNPAWTNYKAKQLKNMDPVILGSAKTQREAFNKFLQHRQNLKLKQKENKYKHMRGVVLEEETSFYGNNDTETIEKDYIEEET